MYPKVIKELIEDFQKLPGIGEKTAERLALYLINNFSMEDAKNFADHIINSKDKLSNCQVCGLITDINPSFVLSLIVRKRLFRHGYESPWDKTSLSIQDIGFEMISSWIKG